MESSKFSRRASKSVYSETAACSPLPDRADLCERKATILDFSGVCDLDTVAHAVSTDDKVFGFCLSAYSLLSITHRPAQASLHGRKRSYSPLDIHDDNRTISSYLPITTQTGLGWSLGQSGRLFSND